MRSKNNLPIEIDPIRTYELLDIMLGPDGLRNLSEKLEVVQLLSIPTTPGTYTSNLRTGEYEVQVGSTGTYLIGIEPLYGAGKKEVPEALRINFHTDRAGVVSILEIRNAQLMIESDAQLVDEIVSGANAAIAERLGLPPSASTLVTYQWYLGSINCMDVPVSVPADSKLPVSATIDSAASEERICAKTSTGVTIDNLAAARLILDKIGLRWPTDELRKKMQQTGSSYPKQLSAFLVSVINEEVAAQTTDKKKRAPKNLVVIVSNDLTDFLEGRGAEVLPFVNKGMSLFRPVWATSPKEAAELFMQHFGILPQNTKVEIQNQTPVKGDAQTGGLRRSSFVVGSQDFSTGAYNGDDGENEISAGFGDDGFSFGDDDDGDDEDSLMDFDYDDSEAVEEEDEESELPERFARMGYRMTISEDGTYEICKVEKDFDEFDELLDYLETKARQTHPRRERGRLRERDAVDEAPRPRFGRASFRDRTRSVGRDFFPDNR